MWSCPCTDRDNCIGAERIDVLKLYEYRKHFRTTAHSKGGLRDASRRELELRYDLTKKTFSRNFKVGSLIDCCAASAGLASGVSFATWASARADVRGSRPYHRERQRVRNKVESEERAHLNAYIRSLRESMEGPKGGSDPVDKWRTGKLPISKRWEQYKTLRNKDGLPIIGSEALFKKLWAEHKEIRECPSKGQPTCDICGELQAQRAMWDHRCDSVAVANMQRCDAAQAEHDREHLGERAYAEDIWFKGEHKKANVTAFSMDAPTETQFDIPVQNRCAC